MLRSGYSSESVFAEVQNRRVLEPFDPGGQEIDGRVWRQRPAPHRARERRVRCFQPGSRPRQDPRIGSRSEATGTDRARTKAQHAPAGAARAGPRPGSGGAAARGRNARSRCPEVEAGALSRRDDDPRRRLRVGEEEIRRPLFLGPLVRALPQVHSGPGRVLQPRSRRRTPISRSFSSVPIVRALVGRPTCGKRKCRGWRSITTRWPSWEGSRNWGQSIPSLLVLDRGSHVVASSYEGEKYLGPQNALAALDKIYGEGRAAPIAAR